jgi:hypothetical protein
MAASNAPGAFPISISSSDSVLMERASLVYREKDAYTVSVLCSTIDLLVPPDIAATVMKIDVEGAELDVLEGARETIEKHKPIVCVEVHGLYFENPYEHVQKVFEFFHAFGYACLNLLKGKEDNLENFMTDSGVPAGDTTVRLNAVGYGNLIFVPNKNLNAVATILAATGEVYS